MGSSLKEREPLQSSAAAGRWPDGRRPNLALHLPKSSVRAVGVCSARQPQLARERRGDFKVSLPRVGLIQDVKIPPTQSNAAKTIVAVGKRDAAHRIARCRAVRRGDAMVTAHHALAIMAVGTIRAVGTANAIVTANEPFAVAAERAARARPTTVALDTGFVLPRAETVHQLGPAAFEFVRVQSPHTIANLG